VKLFMLILLGASVIVTRIPLSPERKQRPRRGRYPVLRYDKGTERAGGAGKKQLRA
jgi:hypothetical protein